VPTAMPAMLRGVLSVIVAAGLLGCAAPASVQGMTPEASALPPVSDSQDALTDPVVLWIREVRGGADISQFGSPGIEDDDFRAALEASLQAAGFQRAEQGQEFALEAQLLELEYPAGALDMPAWLTVRYQLFAEETSEPVFDHTIRSGYAMPFEAAFSGVERLRLAIEGAARDNLAVLLADLMQLGFDQLGR